MKNDKQKNIRNNIPGYKSELWVTDTVGHHWYIGHYNC